MSEPIPAAPQPQPSQQVAVLDIGNLTRQVLDGITPMVKETARQEASLLHESSLKLINGVAADVADNKQAIQDTAASVGQSFVNRLTKDVWLQRALVILVAGSFLAGGFALLAFYLAGSPQAAKAIGWLGLLFGAPLAAAIHQAIGGPGAAKVPVAPVATATAVLQPGQMTAGLVASSPASTTLTVGATP